jgi:hypothetical protein
MAAITSKTEIANLALDMIGAGTLADIDENSNEAKKVRTYYANSLATVLRAGQWSFAIKRAALVRDAADPAFGWSYRFPLPTDCVWLIDFNSQEANAGTDPRFTIENNYVLTNDETGNARYVYLNDNPATYPPDFVTAFSTCLASLICVPISRDAQLAQSLLNKFESLDLPRARRQGLNESAPRRRQFWQNSDFVNSRFTGGQLGPIVTDETTTV